MPRNTAAPPAQRSSIWKISLLALIEFATFGALVAPMAAALSLKVLELVPSGQKKHPLHWSPRSAVPPR
ncbi:hypothetical protein [Arthrobacter sp. NIO-1057]|uniref:hypothetical protein n=1 Tax=Arthrobacter sp. NIO-1057 TaxID=993071 RepID=UPI00071D1358|nr:hypothetical protein [Arthrobacter sp. NIO-1057]KSU65309.1 hypothetical protein AS038_13335 [Arthrobacter sp. NIO-1057]SCC44314.1 hypothetical protein GA0061084_2716 [Arthrobacter sp. NIO-1057]